MTLKELESIEVTFLIVSEKNEFFIQILTNLNLTVGGFNGHYKFKTEKHCPQLLPCLLTPHSVIKTHCGPEERKKELSEDSRPVIAQAKPFNRSKLDPDTFGNCMASNLCLPALLCDLLCIFLVPFTFFQHVV
ncbi:hypothetical protein A6R68_09649, partial [Neotoma lepida]